MHFKSLHFHSFISFEKRRISQTKLIQKKIKKLSLIRATLERTKWGSIWYLAAKAKILASQHFANLHKNKISTTVQPTWSRHSMLVWLHRPTCHQHNLLPGVTAVTTLWYRATDRPLHSLYWLCCPNFTCALARQMEVVVERCLPVTVMRYMHWLHSTVTAAVVTE